MRCQLRLAPQLGAAPALFASLVIPIFGFDRYTLFELEINLFKTPVDCLRLPNLTSFLSDLHL